VADGLDKWVIADRLDENPSAVVLRRRRQIELCRKITPKPSRFKSLASALAREILIRCGRAAVLQELQILTHEAAFKAGAALL
jgi:hypothetical protein